jgi:hypothetical protein
MQFCNNMTVSKFPAHSLGVVMFLYMSPISLIHILYVQYILFYKLFSLFLNRVAQKKVYAFDLVKWRKHKRYIVQINVAEFIKA